MQPVNSVLCVLCDVNIVFVLHVW